jgi:hypothetical protein
MGSGIRKSCASVGDSLSIIDHPEIAVDRGIQMQLMKGICMIQNRMVQEFQHCTESQLIEDMTMKMHLIRFASSVTAIQMKLMKVICMIENRLVPDDFTP